MLLHLANVKLHQLVLKNDLYRNTRKIGIENIAEENQQALTSLGRVLKYLLSLESLKISSVQAAISSGLCHLQLSETLSVLHMKCRAECEYIRVKVCLKVLTENCSTLEYINLSTSTVTLSYLIFLIFRFALTQLISSDTAHVNQFI